MLDPVVRLAHRALAVSSLILLTARCGSVGAPEADGGPYDAAASDSTRPSFDSSSDVGAIANDAATDSPSPRQFTFALQACADSAPAQLPNGEDFRNTTCVRVGATLVVPAASFADSTAQRAPLVYVDSMAMAGGDGTSPARALRTIEAGVIALESRGAGTVMVAAGEYAPAGTIAAHETIAIVGAGPLGATVIHPPTGAPILFSAIGQNVALTLAGVQIGDDHPQSIIAVDVQNAASVTLANVSVQNVATAVHASSASVSAQQLTVRNTTDSALILEHQSTGVLRDFLFDTDDRGLIARDSHATLTQGLVRNAAHGGVFLTGAPMAGVDRIDRVSFLDNIGVGLLVSGATRSVQLSMILIGGTQPPASGDGGDGLFVGGGAHVAVDTNITSDSQQGRGSQFRVNARAGIMVSGAASSITLQGASLGSNGAPGLMMQNGATADLVGYSHFGDNIGAGVLVTSMGSIVGLACNGIVANVRGTLALQAGGVSLADGVVLAPGTPTGSTQVDRNVITGHDRFALLAVGVDVNAHGNTFMSNAFGLGVYNGMTNRDAVTANTDQSFGGQMPTSAPIAMAPGSFGEPAVP